MQTRDVLADAFERVREDVRRLCDGLDAQALSWRPDPSANSIAWLVWHTARVGDAQIADLAARRERWTSQGFAERFDLPFDLDDTGYGHSPEQVGQVRPSDASLLMEYLEAATEFALEYLQKVDADELDRVVDLAWDPPVTAGVRLVSIVNDQAQHVGQAAYVRGLYERAEGIGELAPE